METAIVAAIVVILAGLVIPAIRTWRFETEESRARGDLARIRAALLRFMDDVGVPPTRGRGGADRELFRLLGPGLVADGAYFAADERQGFLEDHLVRNRPSGADEPGYAEWKGPYVDRLTPDPWGFAYVVVAYPLNGGDDRACVVVSAGRNRIMDGSYASTRDPVAFGDDLIEVVSRPSPGGRASVR